MSDNKSRWWACIVWCESNPNWRDALVNLHIPCVVSPCHDMDLKDDGSGELKKAHYHVLFQYGNTTTQKHMNKIITEVISTQGVIPVNSARGYYRYLTHMDNPEKAQYDESDITYLNGFNVNELLSDSDLENIIIDVSKLALENRLTSYKALYLYCLKNGLTEYLKVIQHNTLHFKALCTKELDLSHRNE